MLEKLKKFFAEVKAEAKKTTWPNRDELLASTGVVLFILAVSAVYLFLVDLLFSGTLGALLQKF
ncbi:MAG: preprotein translocase subunit SecE [Fervidobacterium sp.]|jgi:preprotein translocase subunit SecE